MCMVLDTNQWGKFAKAYALYREVRKQQGVSPNNKASIDGDMLCIIKWIQEQGGKLVFPSDKKFKKELSKVGKMMGLFLEYRKRGWTRAYDENAHAKAVANLPDNLKSDDEHVLAAFIASNATVLCTKDKDLLKDFQRLLAERKIQGAIYKGKDNESLLGRDTCP